MNDDDVLTVKQAAVVARVCPATVERMIRDPRHPLPVTRLGSPRGARRIIGRDLREYMEFCRQERPVAARTRRWPGKPGDELRPDLDLEPARPA